MDKKNKLLVSAKHLFATHGFEKTSIRDIAQHAQVNSSMISYYFGSKTGMIPAIFDAFFPKMASMLDITDPKEQLEQIIKMIIDLRKKDVELVDLLHRELMSKENMVHIKPYIEPFWKDIKELLIAGKQCGVFEFDSIEVALKYIQASISYPYHLNLLSLERETDGIDSAFVESITQLIMKGVVKHEV